MIRRRLGIVLTVVLVGGLTGAAPSLAAGLPPGKLALSPAVGRIQRDLAASYHWTTVLLRNGSARGSLAAGNPIVAFTVRARGDQCGGSPLMRLIVDGRAVRTWSVPATRYASYRTSGLWRSGTHSVAVTFLNDRYLRGRCDRNVRVDRVTATVSTNPFLGRHGYLDPNSAAAVAARTASPADAALLHKIADHPQANWLGDWNPTATVAEEVRGWLRAQTAAGALPVLVLYAIPHRDCGSYSAGGLPDATAYDAWLNQIALGIGATRAVVILEPDALPGEDCLTSAQRTEREQILSRAVTRLDRQPGVTVYLDAGNETWHPASVMATRLRAANVSHARGFSLNVSNFYPTASEEHYGDEIVAALGGTARFVVDTARNGRGSNGQWCNPDGRGLGVPWTTSTGDPRTDALIWVKAPGESDGTCNGGPPAGVFWLDYALMLARNAAF